jgi:hypothetical protein
MVTAGAGVDVQRLVARTEICQSGVSVASYTVRGKPVLYNMRRRP